MNNKNTKKYFEIWGDIQSQNSFSKGLLLLTIISNISLLITVINLADKKTLTIIYQQLLPNHFNKYKNYP